MTDQVLDVLKLVLLALLYLFFARVLWAVWSEVRQPVPSGRVDVGPAHAPTPAGGSPTPAGRREIKPVKGKGTPARLLVLEPKERRGTAFKIGDQVGVGRETDNTVVITDDAYISSHHASITRETDRVVVVDLDSRNGTFLNGNKLTERQTLNIGDRLQIGYTVLEAQ